MDTRFHCVYLLTSLDPRCEGDYYIGYTVNPLRRLRQHNGELVNGARRTSRRGRPWRIVCCVSGFTEDRAALKFEWCWQNPTVSARLKHTVGVLRGLRRLPYAVGTLHLLIRAPLFNQLDLTLHVFEPTLLQAAQAEAERFLAVAGRGRRTDASTSPPPPSPAAAAHGTGTTQALNTAVANSGAATAMQALPPLEPSALFHVEVLTRERFEDLYLSHDRCLLLPSVGCGNGSGVTERDGDESGVGASCPYDVSVLSQAARAEWSNASMDNDGETHEADRICYDGDDGAEGDESTRRWGLVGALTPSLSPSRDHCTASRDGTPDTLVRSDSEVAGAEACDRAMLRRPSARSLTPHRSSPSHTVAGQGSVSPLPQRTPPPPSSSPPLPPRTAAAAAPSASAPRIPLRFAHYRDADFAREHDEAQYRLHHGLLPCSLCALPLRPPCVLYCSRAPFCDLRCHLGCLAMWMLYEEEVSGVTAAAAASAAAGTEDRREAAATQQAAAEPPPPFRRLLPSQPCPCPLCGVPLQWGVLIKELKRRAVVEARLQAARRRTRIEQRWQARLAHISGRRSAKETRGLRGRRRRRGSRGSVSRAAWLPPSEAVVSTVRPLSSATTSSDPLCPLAVESHGAAAATAAVAAVDASPVSFASATVPPAEASGLSWTAFCEDEWLL